jgi:hypothetical protein
MRCARSPAQDSITGCPSAPVAHGDTVTLTANGAGIEGAATYTWTVDGVAAGTGETLDVSCAMGKIFVVEVTCEDEIDCCPPAPATCEITCDHTRIRRVPCDYNNDGNFDISDPLALLGLLFTGGPDYEGRDDCAPDSFGRVMDCNGDGEIDLSDVVCKLSFLFLGGRMPTPFARADEDGCISIECETPYDPTCP